MNSGRLAPGTRMVRSSLRGWLGLPSMAKVFRSCQDSTEGFAPLSIGSTQRERQALASNGSPKYCVSRAGGRSHAQRPRGVTRQLHCRANIKRADGPPIRRTTGLYSQRGNGDSIAENPDRFVGFAGIDIRRSADECLAEIERCFSWRGFVGVSIEPGASDPAMAADDRRLISDLRGLCAPRRPGICLAERPAEYNGRRFRRVQFAASALSRRQGLSQAGNHHFARGLAVGAGGAGLGFRLSKHLGFAGPLH